MRYTNPVITTFIPNDGDTVGLIIGLSGTLSERLIARIVGYDCPETRRTKCGKCGLHTSPYEMQRAIDARLFTHDFILSSGQLTSIREEKRDSFGRELVQLHHELGDIVTDLGVALHDAELATVWPTRWHHVYDPQRDRTG